MTRTNPYELGLDKNAANFVALSPLSFIERSAGVYPDRTAVIYCYSQTCKLAAAAAVEFASAGIAVVEMEGGFEAWQKNDLPVEQ